MVNFIKYPTKPVRDAIGHQIRIMDAKHRSEILLEIDHLFAAEMVLHGYRETREPMVNYITTVLEAKRKELEDELKGQDGAI